MIKTVLIVDDAELDAKLYRDMLEGHGFKTLYSPDGSDVLELTREHRPDLIIMDIQLPGKSGIDHIITLKSDAAFNSIPIIAVTALAMVGDKEKILSSGCDAYLSKPISVPDFLKEVQNFISMGAFRLTASLITGHDEVDAQHDHLGALLNGFMDHYKSDDFASCDKQLDKITKAIKTHFANEEEIMDGLGYDNLKPHQDEHIKVLGKFDEHLEVLERFSNMVQDAKENGYTQDFTNKLTSILVQDMIRADLDFKRYLEEINYKEQKQH